MPSLPAHIELGEMIGSTATATIWEARDRLAGQDVVVKVLHGTDATRRVEVEARAMARLGRHPHLLEVRDVGMDPSADAWVVTSRAGGGSLADRVNPSPQDALEWISQSAVGLAHVHSNGIVHGDLTPSNILLSHGVGGSGEHRWVALLADFGSANIDGEGALEIEEGTLVGCTPAFSAPERLRGDLPTMAGDVFGLARTAHEVIGTDGLERISRRARRLLRRSLHPDPSKRPAAALLARGLR